jgi:hypothetical protein
MGLFLARQPLTTITATTNNTTTNNNNTNTTTTNTSNPTATTTTDGRMSLLIQLLRTIHSIPPATRLNLLLNLTLVVEDGT